MSSKSGAPSNSGLPDNRMMWIRELESAEDTTDEYGHTELEFASESHIPGILAYDSERIKCGLCAFDTGTTGMNHYLLVFDRPKFDVTGYLAGEASAKGYFFSGGPGSELLALFSLFLEARIFPISVTSGRLTSHGIPSRYYFSPTPFLLNKRSDPLHRDIERNFSIGLSEFLDKVRTIPEKYQLQIALSAHNYAEGLREIGLSEEMAIIRLVSAAEILAKGFPLPESDDLFSRQQLQDYLKTDEIESDVIEELTNLFAVRKSRLRFIRFLQKYAEGFIRQNDSRPDHIAIKHSNFYDTLDAIYRARSGFLHAGAPMYTSTGYQATDEYDFSADVGKKHDQRWFDPKDKLPYASVFQRIVRHAFLNYLDELTGDTDHTET